MGNAIPLREISNDFFISGEGDEQCPIPHLGDKQCHKISQERVCF